MAHGYPLGEDSWAGHIGLELGTLDMALFELAQAGEVDSCICGRLQQARVGGSSRPFERI